MDTEAATLSVAKRSKNRDALMNCLAGTVGGVGQVLTGQPFDTLKVRLQSNPSKYTGALDCMRQLVRENGVSGLYKGTTSPLIGIGACVSIQFLALERMKSYYLGKSNQPGLTGSQLFMSGGVAGLANSVASCPVEHIRGVPTLVREFFGYGVYFYAYEYLVQHTMHTKNIKRSEISPLTVCLYGGIAGISMWITLFPVDVIKTRIQTDSFANPKYKSSLDCIRKSIAESGFSGLYRGLTPCLIRAVPANAATFICFEYALRFLQNHF
ncbi:hypothetical protein BB560_003271 [Smittium megazygosporum]|uniref:Mitochondrial carrier protein n=1 Tax=Smittium megazygosporum TaxID=133381 RepID=A0A2T9ZCF4_9FUNG|nr:hypothetical protein BB560_003271 [Smittium megazygosporum]